MGLISTLVKLKPSKIRWGRGEDRVPKLNTIHHLGTSCRSNTAEHSLVRRAMLEESSSSSGDELVSEDDEVLGTGVIGCGFVSLLSSGRGLALEDDDPDPGDSC
jgi:hypothetical protein